jgi:ubiquitin-like 1-activating enzyme E1 A
VVETISSVDVSSTEAVVELLQSLLSNVDLVCLTDARRDQIININDVCRAHQTMFYAGGSYGLMGYVFCDLLDHEYIAT